MMPKLGANRAAILIQLVGSAVQNVLGVVDLEVTKVYENPEGDGRDAADVDTGSITRALRQLADDLDSTRAGLL